MLSRLCCWGKEDCDCWRFIDTEGRNTDWRLPGRVMGLARGRAVGLMVVARPVVVGAR